MDAGTRSQMGILSNPLNAPPPTPEDPQQRIETRQQHRRTAQGGRGGVIRSFASPPPEEQTPETGTKNASRKKLPGTGKTKGLFSFSKKNKNIVQGAKLTSEN